MKSLKSLKTPLRYPGGKSKAIKTLSQWYPKVITEYREPFIGGGSIAIDVTKANPDIPVWINDLYVPLYNFWVQLRDRGQTSLRVSESRKRRCLRVAHRMRRISLLKICLIVMPMKLILMMTFRKAVAFFIMNSVVILVLPRTVHSQKLLLTLTFLWLVQINLLSFLK